MSDPITFRIAQREDEPILREMLYLAIFVPPGETPPLSSIVTKPELSRYVYGWGRPCDDGIVALSEGIPVGAAWIRLWSEDDHGYGFVNVHTPELSVAVQPEFRNRGIGTRLLRDLLQRADRTHESVSLSVSIANPSMRLYEKLRFVVVASDGRSATMRRMRE